MFISTLTFKRIKIEIANKTENIIHKNYVDLVLIYNSIT